MDALKTKMSRRGIVAAAVAVAVGVIALLPGAFGPALAQTVPPPPAPATVSVTVIVNNQERTFVTTPGGLATLEIPAGSQITSIALDVLTSPAATADTADAALDDVLDFLANEGLLSTNSPTLVGYLFNIHFDPGSASTQSQRLVMDAATLAQMPRNVFQAGPIVLAQPATATLNVLPETLAQVGGDLSRIFVVYVDAANGVTEEVTMLPSPGPGVVAFEFTKEGAYAVMIRPIVVGAVPAPAATGIDAVDEASSRSMLPLAAALAGVVALGAAGVGLARRSR